MIDFHLMEQGVPVTIKRVHIEYAERCARRVKSKREPDSTREWQNFLSWVNWIEDIHGAEYAQGVRYAYSQEVLIARWR